MKSLFSIFTAFLCLSLNAQNIRTAQLFNPKTNDLTPFISKSEYLIFSFDDLDAGYKRFTYKIVRYNKNWEPSDIYPSEFLNGYDKNYIKNYKNSFNTRVNYTHYELKIPNNDFSFKLSGNYGIQILKPYSNEILLEKRFSVYDNTALIGVKVTRANATKELNQQIDVQVHSDEFDLTQNNPLLVIIKNNNWNETLKITNPSFSQPNQLTYTDFNHAFSGGVEYQWFDTKDLGISGLTTENYILDDIYHTYLYPIRFYTEQNYIDKPDVDGNYFIRSTHIPNESSAGYEADYTQVYFSLDGYQPSLNEKVFVYGAFNDFKPTSDSFLSQNPSTGLWETRLLLKQGYYNYSFGVLNTDNNQIEYDKITGSYWQTENQYDALFYYTPLGKRYDLLIGHAKSFSRPNQR